MVMIHKTYHNAYIKRTLGNSAQAEGTSNKGKSCHMIVGWPLVSICCEESNLGQKQFHWEGNLPGHCLASPFETLFFPFLPILTSCNKPSVSVCSQDSHPLCQETCESDAFIFEGMCLCRKPTPIRGTLTQFYLNLQTHRGGVSWWKGFLGYIGRGLRSQFCPSLGCTAFARVPCILWALVSSFENG